jgi:ABC-type branched-subunit amino acid transport system substrate-binding protein
MRRATTLFFALSISIAFGLVAGCKNSESGRPIEIGHIYASNQSNDEVHAIQMAVEELNGDPARLPQGRRIHVRHSFGGSKPDEWGAQATRLMSLNLVVGLVCGGRTDDADKVGTAVSADGVVAISTAGWAAAPSQNLFTIGLAPSERGRALALYVKEKNPKSLLVVRDPAAKSARLAADRFLAELVSNSIRISEVDASTTDKPAAEAVFFACSPKSALEYRPKDTLRIFGDDPAELFAAGTAAEGFIVATAYHAGVTNERLNSFVGKFQKAHGRAPTTDAVLTYDEITTWVEAARRANGTDKDALRTELLKHDAPFESLTGPLWFAQDQSARRPVFVGRIADGQLTHAKQYDPWSAN